MDSAPAVQCDASGTPCPPAEPISKSEIPKALWLLRFMLLSRGVDRMEMELVNRGEAFFHVGGAGHEAAVALVPHLTPDDWIHPHYRDKALMLARGVSAEQFFHGLLGSAGSTSQGRQMCAHLTAPEVRILTMTGPVGNNALPAVGVAHEIVAGHLPPAPGPNGFPRTPDALPLVVCSNGDSTTQQGEFLEAIAEAVRAELPVLFLVEDNGYGISTRTARNTFYHLPSGPVSEFYGLPIHRLDGQDVLGCHAALGPIVASVRQRKPAIVVMEVERLTHHTNADDERIYRDESEIHDARRHADPIERLLARLRASGVREQEIQKITEEVDREIRVGAERALVAPNPEANLDARAPAAVNPTVPPALPVDPAPARGTLTMLEAMREVLRRQVAADPRVTLFGEDIEDPKGDVFGLTRGLSTAYPGQVRNSALTESTIVGVSLGRALVGGRPVAMIQFSDFLPLAFNQVASELATIYWRSAGGYTAPVIMLAPSGAYRPGLGPYHSQPFDTTFAHLPGLDVVVPSTAADAAGLLNAAFANQSTGRPTLFLYPKVCLNDPSVGVGPEGLSAVIPSGRARTLTQGDDLTLVAWGSTVPIAQRAVQLLQTAGVGVDLIDLRSLSPWDKDAVAASVRRTRRLIVVQEDNLTAGFGAEVVAATAEVVDVPFQSKRLARPDTYVPFNYVNQLDVLPGLRQILEAAGTLCDIEVSWEEEVAPTAGQFVLEATGSSPADQTMSIVEWKVAAGDRIAAGDLIADCEADKATFELRAPIGGVIRDLLDVDQKVAVGSPIAKIATDANDRVLPRRIPHEPKPVLRRRSASRASSQPTVAAPAVAPNLLTSRRPVVGLSSIAPVPAGRVVTNEEMIQRFPGRSPHDITQRTGIESRRLLAPGESALTLATQACRNALRESGLTVQDLDAILVSTSTPMSVSPSMACLIHHQLALDGNSKDVAASDLFAACSGYLYALQTAFDYCQSKPAANILVVTAEAMSEFTNPNDFDTAIVFADAATATLVHGPASPAFGRSKAHLHRPVLSARGEDGTILNHGRRSEPNVNMDGLKVFPMAVRQLIALLKEACVENGIKVEELDYIVPHQANGRILDAVDQRLKLPKGRLVNRVKHSGNTSSSTIPIVLAELLREGAHGKIGLCAFGGGFTFGAAVMEIPG